MSAEIGKSDFWRLDALGPDVSIGGPYQARGAGISSNTEPGVRIPGFYQSLVSRLTDL
jgi:hypothetical protein